MQILLPPSEGKRQPVRGKSLVLDALSCQELTARREQLLQAVAEAAGRDNAPTLFGVPHSQAELVARNASLVDQPTARASEIYEGVLYQALDLADMDTAAKRRAARSVLISSALFGVLRLGDRIPAYKLSMGAKLPGIGTLAGFWRPVLGPALAGLAERELLVDCRSGSYAAAWKPVGAAWVRIVVPGATHHAKYTRGLVTGALCRAASVPSTAQDLADLLAAEFTVALAPAPSARDAAELSVAAA